MRLMMTMLLVGVMLFAAGCENLGFKGDQIHLDARQAVWPFAPVAMRVHPFSTFEPGDEPETLVLEARVELLDRVGDTTKGVGRFRFELYQIAAAASREGEDLRLMQWDGSIDTLELNRRHYDPITRTYVFKLKIDEPIEPRQKLRLDVQYTNQVDERLSTQFVTTYTPRQAE